MAGIAFAPNIVGTVILEDGSVTNATLATDAIDANAIADDAVAEIGEGVYDALNVAVPSAPTADSLFDILSKGDGNSYNRATDSLEALADAISAISTGTYMKRSAQSGSLLMTGSEQTLYELAPGQVFEFGGGSIKIPASASAAFACKVYIKNKSGGSYIDITPTNFLAQEDSYVVFANSFDNTSNSKRGFTPKFVQYGLKITLQQGTVGAGYVTVDHEWFDTIGT